jgi:hypothetical protein
LHVDRGFSGADKISTFYMKAFFEFRHRRLKFTVASDCE